MKEKHSNPHTHTHTLNVKKYIFGSKVQKDCGGGNFDSNGG